MTALELAQKRYATKKYNPDKEIPAEKIEELKKVLHLAPSSINIQPWQFHFVEDAEMKSKLADVSMHNTEKVNQAGLLIVFSVVDDLNKFQEVVDRDMAKARADWYKSIKDSLSEVELRHWLAEQVNIALGFALSAAIQLGLDSTPMGGIEKEKYKDILKLDGYMPVVAMAVGYGADDDFNRPEVSPKNRRPFEDVVKTI